MLTKRVIPCLDVHEGRVVKGVNFVDLVDAGDPVELAAFYDAEGADELVFLDITASHEERPSMLDVAARTSEEVFIPYTVGGGMRSAADIRAMLSAGATRSRSTRRRCAPELITAHEPHLRFAVHRRRHRRAAHPGSVERWEVFINGGRINTGLDAVEWARERRALGAGEILLTSMDRDGTNEGLRHPLTRAITREVTIPSSRAAARASSSTSPRSSSRRTPTPCWRRARCTSAGSACATSRHTWRVTAFRCGSWRWPRRRTFPGRRASGGFDENELYSPVEAELRCERAHLRGRPAARHR
jgi:imidazole glycerol-phosphate synthase subunit HisF